MEKARRVRAIALRAADGEGVLKDLRFKLEKYRNEAEDCDTISKTALDAETRVYFAKLALLFRALVRDVEAEIRRDGRTH